MVELRNYIDSRCIMRVPLGSRELPAMEPGHYYTWQFYLQAAVLRYLHVIGMEFWNRFQPRFDAQPFQLGAMESAGTAILAAILMTKPVPVTGFTIRKERKSYGLKNMLEGEVTGQPVVFIDDLTSPQHNAFWHAVGAIKDAKLCLAPRAFVLVCKSPGDLQIPTSMGPITVESLFTLDDFGLV